MLTKILRALFGHPRAPTVTIRVMGMDKEGIVVRGRNLFNVKTAHEHDGRLVAEIYLDAEDMLFGPSLEELATPASTPFR